MEIRFLLGINIFLLSLITFFIRAWINETKKEIRELRNMDIKELQEKIHLLNIEFTKLETQCNVRHMKGEE